MFFIFFLASMLNCVAFGSQQSPNSQFSSYESLGALSSSQRSCNDLPVKIVLANGRYQWNPYAAPKRFIAPVNPKSPKHLPAPFPSPCCSSTDSDSDADLKPN